MNNLKSYLKDLSLFKLEDLHGKTLQIHVGQSEEDGYETTAIMGLDTTTGVMYFLNSTQKHKGDGR